MKRPAAVCGFTSAVGLLFVILLFNEKLKIQLFLSVTCLFLFLFSILIKSFRENRTIPVIFISLSVSFAVLFLNSYSNSKIISKYENKKIDISAHFVSSAKFYDGRYRYTVKTDTINDKNEKLIIDFSLDYPLNAKITDEIYISCMPSKRYDNAMYYFNRLSNGTLLSVNRIHSFSISENAAFSSSKDIEILLLRLRMFLENNIMSNLKGENGALLVGLCFGDKGNISRQIITDFQTCGISHLLAVSGFHLTVWVGTLYLILNKIKLDKKVIAIICMGFILFFSALTGFGTSIVRAGFMLGLFYFGFLFNKVPDALNSIGAALCFLILKNPFYAVSVSLWFSILSTVGLIMLSKPLLNIMLKLFKRIENEFILKLIYVVLSGVSASIATIVFCIPIYIFVFPTISVIQIISNLIFVFIASVAMILGGASSVAFAFNVQKLGKILVSCAGFLSKLLIKGTSKLSEFRYSLYPISSLAVKISLLILFISVFLVVFTKLKKSVIYKRILIALSVFIIAFNVIFYINGYRNAKLSIFNFKSGASAIVSYKGQNIVLSASNDYHDGLKLCNSLYRYGAGFVDLAIVQGYFTNAKPLQRVNENYRIKTAAFNDKISESYIRANYNVLVTEGNENFYFSGQKEKLEMTSDGRSVILYVNKRKIVLDLTEEQKMNNIDSDLYIPIQSIVNMGDIDVIIKNNGKINIEKANYGNN